MAYFLEDIYIPQEASGLLPGRYIYPPAYISKWPTSWAIYISFLGDIYIPQEVHGGAFELMASWATNIYNIYSV